jgi:polyisoprenoid-binding protein YceI
MTNTTSSIPKFTLDPGHSAVGFSVRHLMITNVRGEFEKFSGTIGYDPSRPDATTIEASIDVASINTREQKRDADLRSPLFFDAESHPTMSFVSKSARSVGPGAVDVLGTLTLRGIGKDVTLAVRDISDLATDMRGNQRLGATASAKIQRADYGITWNKALDAGGVVVGETVTITIEVSLVKAT